MFIRWREFAKHGWFDNFAARLDLDEGHWAEKTTPENEAISFEACPLSDSRTHLFV
ncbi:hypothetical protein [Bradyrhizobium sp. Tv2a-2]|uniref:hypothetical protein n=1 Tax=Bradyrhizobium sp. Tv2a-2 TaxID=113395 RepID=UPI000407947B|nr:hypothetical protein [Bradyrhizobium sp. Tv2a-2]